MSLNWIRLVSLGAALAVVSPAPVAFAKQNRGHHGRHANGLDRNGDGVITRAEWRGNNQSFRVHDRNRDGIISASDRHVAWPGGAVHGWDFNRNGVVSFREWRGDRQTFHWLDLNNDGLLSAFELRRL